VPRSVTRLAPLAGPYSESPVCDPIAPAVRLAATALAEDFLRSYHRYADQLFRCYMDAQPHRSLQNANFRFELYASGEYSRMLEREWAEI